MPHPYQATLQIIKTDNEIMQRDVVERDPDSQRDKELILKLSPLSVGTIFIGGNVFQNSCTVSSGKAGVQNNLMHRNHLCNVLGDGSGWLP